MDNCVNSTKKLLDLLRVKNTRKYIEDFILSHPEYNSLLSIKDILDKYNVENIAVNIGVEKLDKIPVPCIAQVKKGRTPLFVVIKGIERNKITYFDSKNKLITVSKEGFENIWTGVCLLVETSELSKEPGIDKKLSDNKIFNLFTVFATFLLTFWITNSFVNSESETFSNVSYVLTVGLYAILKISGLIVGVALLWFEIDQYNPTLQSFCTGGSGSKVNCNAVLGSKYAKLFNDSLSLSLLVFSYFFATLGYLLINKFLVSSISTLSLFSFISFPIIAISIYYQAFVIKQWCKFCIVVQIIILAEIALAFFAGFFNNFNIFDASLLGFLFFVPIIAWKFLKPLLENQKEVNLHKRGLKKIKNNPNVLEGLLVKSRKIETSTEGLGISIQNKEAKYHVIKVCNPYCGPCAKAHPVLESLVNAGKINLQILFTAKSVEDRMGKPVSHFLAIDSKNEKHNTQKALDDWYLAEHKDYDLFANKYPINGELEQQKNKIEAMRIWCDNENITHTPTIFINGYELPKEYTVKDLVEVLQ